MPEVKVKRTRNRLTNAQKQDKLIAEQAKNEVYDHLKIRKEARVRVPGALDVLDKIMSFDAFELRIRAEERLRVVDELKKFGCDKKIIEKVEALAEPILNHEASVQQMLKAAELILDRAGDKPAVAPPSTDNIVFDYLEMNPTIMPKAPKK